MNRRTILGIVAVALPLVIFSATVLLASGQAIAAAPPLDGAFPPPAVGVEHYDLGSGH